MSTFMKNNQVKPKKEYVLDYSNLHGGINLWDPDDRLKPNESPEMKNLLWRNGMLCSRKGQYFLSDTELGQGFAAFPRLWHGCIFAHIGEGLYCFRIPRNESSAMARERPQAPCKRATERSEALGESQQTTASPAMSLSAELNEEGTAGSESGLPTIENNTLYNLPLMGKGDRSYAAVDEVSAEHLCSNIPPVRGTFFTYSDKLYYKTTGVYKEISAELVNGEWTFTAATVYPYEPVILINASPQSGAGDLYQPENRLSSRKTVWYNASNGVKTYVLPVVATRVTYVEVDGVQLTTGWSYDRQNGKVLFQTAPPVTDPPTNNTVRITYELSNPEAQKSIMDCRYAAVYGGTGELCVVMAGSEDQPNAYFWSGNSNIKMDAGYFPLEQVQLAGSTEERITGFGKQQDNLIIFKEGSVGKTTLGTQTINDRIYIDLPYIPINASIGCDLPWSIQLVENNLVFANRTGIYTLLDTTAANENNIVCISRKLGDRIQDTGDRKDEICSADDGSHYYLTGNGVTFCWNYELSSWKDPSWFYLTNTNAVALICEAGKIFHVDFSGRLTGLQPDFNDYGNPIERLFRFPTMNFGSYDCHKNVNSVILTLGAGEEENTELWYLTDYEIRKDLTNLQVVDETSSGLLIENNSLYNPPLAGRGDRRVATVGEVETANFPVGTRPSSSRIPAVFRRRPMCRRVLYFTMKLINENLNEDFELVGAQVYYNIQGRLR
ncbi:MAG: hypothetical protein IJ237_02850 [Oscillospiraceae bacterium]|nr:hypothetical protein [Oscillospiraceae bacterium]